MGNHKKQKIYIFFDESGKPEIYSAKGVNLVETGVATKYLVLASVRVGDQLFLQQSVTDFKLRLLKDESFVKIFSSAYALDSFHAQSDYPQVREKFYDFINNMPDVKIDVLVAEKLKCFPNLRTNPDKLYGVMAGHLLKNITHQADATEIIFSRKDSKLMVRREMEAEIERIRLHYLETHPNIDRQFNLSYQHNPHYTHGGLQVADYVAYAVFQAYENQNQKWLDMIQAKIGIIRDICNKKYFTRSNPLKLST